MEKKGMQFYIKNEAGEEQDATEIVNSVVENRLKKFKDSETSKIREKVIEETRDELTPVLTKEIEDKMKNEYQPKLDEANAHSKKLETQLLQKTIAAEYGFKPGTETFLGNGSADEMRKNADTLKESFSVTGKAPKKETSTGKSLVQERTGIKVQI